MEESITLQRPWSAVRRDAMRVLENVRSCSYCGIEGDSDHGPDGKPWTIDHVVPKDKGGSDNPHNLVKACHRCNCKKHTKIGGEWTPRADALTAGGILWSRVYSNCFPENYTNVYEEVSPDFRDAYTERCNEIEQLSAELREAKNRIMVLERCIWDLRHALGSIETVARYSYGSVEISYNPSEGSYK